VGGSGVTVEVGVAVSVGVTVDGSEVGTSVGGRSVAVPVAVGGATVAVGDGISSPADATC